MSREGFTNQKRRIFSEEESKARWGGERNGLFCTLCNHKFVVGNGWRWVYANGGIGVSYGNFQVCDVCDGPDVLDRYQAACSLIHESMKNHEEGHWPVNVAAMYLRERQNSAFFQRKIFEALGGSVGAPPWDKISALRMKVEGNNA